MTSIKLDACPSEKMVTKAYDSMDAEDIKAALGKKGLNLAMLAERAGPPMTRQKLAAALVRPYEAPEKIIADALGIPASQIWPQRYHRNGLRKKPQDYRLYAVTPRFRRAG